MTSLDISAVDDVKRLGRAVVFVHQHDAKIVDPLIRAEVEILLLTGRAMDFAARLKGHSALTSAVVHHFARFGGVGRVELTQTVLPALRRAGLIDYTVDSSGALTGLEEFVGISASVTEQTVALLNSLSPQSSDLAFLHSVEVGAIAPLAESQHLEEIVKRGFTDGEASVALRLSRAVGINLNAPSEELQEPVVFSPYVWGTRNISLASFLAGLPPNERDVLLGMSEQVLSKPGINMTQLSASPSMLRSAQGAGLIQMASVQSSTGAASTYAFSPLLETEDNKCTTTEAFHLRKLFVAHILFGHEKALAGGGTINNPAVLVNSLLNKGSVGPATNIGTDYHLLEAAGVVAVKPGSGDRAFLTLVKPEIAQSGLEWIRRINGMAGGENVSLTQRPTSFKTPEDFRSEVSQGASNEIMAASINELRKETQRAARRDDPWS